MSAVEDMIEIEWADWSTSDGPAKALKLGPIDRWTAIEVHHGGSAYAPGTDILNLWDQYRRYHENGKGWATIWYHLGLHPDGRLASLRGPLASNSSRKYLTVNLPGHGSQTTEAQWQTLYDLRVALALDGGGTELRYHAQRGGTSCPGTDVINRIHSIWAEEEKFGFNVVVPDGRTEVAGMVNMNHPVVGMVTVPGVPGYATVHADGGVATFGGFPYLGSVPEHSSILYHPKYPDRAVGAEGVLVDGEPGYHIFTERGAIYSFGSAAYAGRPYVEM
jgi:hypothetical protein